MKRCKWCDRGWWPDRDGYHRHTISIRNPTIEIMKCPNHRPLDKQEDLEMTYEKLGRTYEEL